MGMMTITDRDELIDLFTDGLIAAPDLSLGRMAKLISLFEDNLDWFSEQGLALVPRVSTEEMALNVNMGMKHATTANGILDGANKVGDLLTTEKV